MFLVDGYVGTHTDQIAAASAISKQTIHNLFDTLIPLMHSAPDAKSAITLLAEQFPRSIMNRQVQDIRRLVLAEAVRFPHLGRLYWQNGFQRVLTSMASCLHIISERGLLTIARPDVAAQQLAGMLLWIPSNRLMFCGSNG